jgi:17beta-estradiol 17-dehydrogenase / very-long-chain 3-oxoacyl-CoA reductase
VGSTTYIYLTKDTHRLSGLPHQRYIKRLAVERDEMRNKQTKMHCIQLLLSEPPCFLLLFLLGLFSLKSLFISFLSFIYTYLLRPQKNLRHYGKWAVVTGPTSGIGLSLAFELAKNGMNLILVGIDKLEQVKMEIYGQHESIEIKTVFFDLSCDLAKGIETLRFVF